MKIKSIQTHYVRIPFDMGAPRQDFAGLRFPTMDHLLVQVETDDGLIGWGEGFGHTIIPATKAALETYVGPWFIGKDPTDINALHREAAQSFHIFGRNGPVVYAHSAIDIALWDIAGKRAGLPLCDLLGGARRKEVRAYSSLMRYANPATVGRICAREGAARLPTHQAARAQHRGSQGRARGRGSRHRHHERRQLPLDRRAGHGDGARLPSGRPLLARGTGMAAGGPRRARPRAPPGHDAHSSRRERCRPARLPRHVHQGLDRHRPAERDQDRRHHRDAKDRRARRGALGGARAALRLLRAGQPRLDPHRRVAARRTRCSRTSTPTWRPAPSATPCWPRTARCACRPAPASASSPTWPSSRNTGRVRWGSCDRRRAPNMSMNQISSTTACGILGAAALA